MLTASWFPISASRRRGLRCGPVTRSCARDSSPVPLYQYLTRGRLRMVLEGIEAELRTNKAESREVPGNLHIEHVMPQTWHPNWPLPGEVAEDEEAVADRDRAIPHDREPDARERSPELIAVECAVGQEKGDPGRP